MAISQISRNFAECRVHALVHVGKYWTHLRFSYSLSRLLPIPLQYLILYLPTTKAWIPPSIIDNTCEYSLKWHLLNIIYYLLFSYLLLFIYKLLFIFLRRLNKLFIHCYHYCWLLNVWNFSEANSRKSKNLQFL